MHRSLIPGPPIRCTGGRPARRYLTCDDEGPCAKDCSGLRVLQPRGHLFWVWKDQENDQQFSSKSKGQEAFSAACQILELCKPWSSASTSMEVQNDDSLPGWCCSNCACSFWTKGLKQSLNSLFFALSPFRCPRHWMLVLLSQEGQTWFPFHLFPILKCWSSLESVVSSCGHQSSIFGFKVMFVHVQQQPACLSVLFWGVWLWYLAFVHPLPCGGVRHPTVASVEFISWINLFLVNCVDEIG